jgi:hypothetical protein
MVRDRATSRHLTSFGGVEQRLQVLQPQLMPKINKRITLFPIIFFQIYLAASVFVFAFGPWHWPVSNPLQLYSFLLLAQLALLIGYLQAIKKKPQPASTKLNIPLIVTVSLVFNYLWIPQIYETRTGQAFNIGAAIHAAITGLTDPGRQYLEKSRYTELHLISSAGNSTAIGYVTFFVYPIMSIAFPLGVIFWKQLKVSIRIALVGFIILDLSIWAASGMNKGIADFVLLLPWLLVARKPTLLTKIKLQDVLKIGMLAMLGFSVLFAFFSIGMLGRSRGSTMSRSDTAVGIAPEFDGPILGIVPSELQLDVASLASYFSQGYYPLSLSLKEPFVFCYGVGNSYFLEGLSRHFVNTPIFEDTYPARIQSSGWDAHGKWHSIYPWIASDLSFPGTLVFMFLLGRLFAMVWLDVAFCRNPWAIGLFPLVLTILFYVPANNQVLGFPGQATPFWALLFLWYCLRGGSKKTRWAFNSIAHFRR